MSWTPIFEPPSAPGPVELKLADGTVVNGGYCEGGGWVAHFGSLPVVWSPPAFWRPVGSAS